MKLERLRIENFRVLRSLDIQLDAQFNVLVGINGAGKSSLLAAIDILMRPYVNGLRSNRVAGVGIANELVRRGAKLASLKVEASDSGNFYEWSLTKPHSASGRRITITNYSGARQYVDIVNGRLEKNEKSSLPLYMTYPVNRAVLDIPLRIREKLTYNQVAALDTSSLETARNFRRFFAWFRDREDIENERRIEDKRYRDPHLSAVRRAIETVLPSFTNLRVKRQPLRMVVSKDGEEFRVDDLSDGEKVLLALVGDLAKRLALANPSLTNPLLGSAIVLIDEIELHLHPGWQRRAVNCLRVAFPNTQFIVSTHSPQVVSELRPDQVFLLEDGHANRPMKTYGRNSSEILEDIMDADPRPERIQRSIGTLYEQIDGLSTSALEKRLKAITNEIGEDDPALTAARLEIRRRSIARQRASDKKTS